MKEKASKAFKGIMLDYVCVPVCVKNREGKRKEQSVHKEETDACFW